MVPNPRKSIGVFHSYFPWTNALLARTIFDHSISSWKLACPYCIWGNCTETAIARQRQPHRIQPQCCSPRHLQRSEPWTSWLNIKAHTKVLCMLVRLFCRRKRNKQGNIYYPVWVWVFCCFKSDNFSILFLPGPGGEGGNKTKQSYNTACSPNSCKPAAGVDVQTQPHAGTRSDNRSVQLRCSLEKKKDGELTQGIHSFMFRSSKARAHRELRSWWPQNQD